ncbi:unnamed protein product [Linum trigynum]|uniref:Uncharacterized protein n=1 Tax=Linum trigynum TaxID=586398 RepID=A0AAV2FR11_9ROSI
MNSSNERMIPFGSLLYQSRHIPENVDGKVRHSAALELVWSCIRRQKVLTWSSGSVLPLYVGRAGGIPLRCSAMISALSGWWSALLGGLSRYCGDRCCSRKLRSALPGGSTCCVSYAGCGGGTVPDVSPGACWGATGVAHTVSSTCCVSCAGCGDRAVPDASHGACWGAAGIAPAVAAASLLIMSAMTWLICFCMLAMTSFCFAISCLISLVVSSGSSSSRSTALRLLASANSLGLVIALMGVDSSGELELCSAIGRFSLLLYLAPRWAPIV